MSTSASIVRVREWHEELLEYILANPRASLHEISLYFQVTPAWISTVRNSDAFKELWSKRRGEHFTRVSMTVNERLQVIADVTLDALTDRVEQEVQAGTANLDDLLEVSDLVLKNLGYGNKNTAPNTVVTTNNIVITAEKEMLSQARERMAELARKHTQVIEHVREDEIEKANQHDSDEKERHEKEIFLAHQAADISQGD